MSKNLADFDQKSQDLSSKVAMLESQVKNLTNKLADCGNISDRDALSRLENVERRQRCDDLIIEGLRIDKKLTLKQNVIKKIDRSMKYRLYSKDFKHVSVFTTDEKDNITAVKAIFFNPDTKEELLKRKTRLRNTGIYLKEYLTIPQKLLLDEAREAQKHGIFKQVFSKGGLIYGTEEYGGKAEKIFDLAKLKHFNKEMAEKQKAEDRNKSPTEPSTKKVHGKREDDRGCNTKDESARRDKSAVRPRSRSRTRHSQHQLRHSRSQHWDRQCSRSPP